MEPKRWDQMWDVFHQVLEETPRKRAGLLDQLCADENELRRKVERLLAANDDAPSVLNPLEGNDDAAVDPLIGGRIGAYLLQQIIGRGGMGTVYAAQQLEPIQRPVALKLIKLGMDTEEVVNRFEAERQALALMNHPHIATVHDAGSTEDGRPYFVMELVDGLPIIEFCDSAGLTINERVELFLPVCNAVQHAHQKGIIHRDLKPSNILVTRHDDRAISKVIDFGIAKAMHRPLTGHDPETLQGQLIGTPAYMSPEQASGAIDVDTRSDVYSLGVVLYELLAGASPTAAGAHHDDSHLATPSGGLSRLGDRASEVACHRATNVAALRRLLRGDLDWIVMRALEFDRDRRYATAAELGADLNRHLHDQPVLAGPPSVKYRLRKLVLRHRLGFAVGISLIAALLLGIMGTTWMAVVARNERRAAVAARDQAQEEAETAQAVIRVLDEMLSAPDPMGDFQTDGAARDVKVREVLDRSTEILPTLGERPAVEAALRRTLGRTYLNLGDAQAAEEHFLRARELNLAEFGPDHPDSLASSHHVARALRKQGRLEEAESILQAVFEQRRQVLGPEHPDTLATMHNLALVVYFRGRHADAERLFQELIPMQKAILGDQHPDVLNSLNSSCLILSRRGEHAEAEAVAREALQLQQQALGDDHPRTLLILGSLATVLEEGGNLELAETIFSDLVERYRQILGGIHPSTLLAMQNLASVLTRLGRHAEAVPLYREALNNSLEVLPKDHPNALVIAHNLARTLTDSGAAAEAVTIYPDILNRARQRLGPEHYIVGTFEGGLGMSLLRLDRFPEAEVALLASHKKLEAVFGPDHRRTQTARERLAQLYEVWGRPIAADRYR